MGDNTHVNPIPHIWPFSFSTSAYQSGQPWWLYCYKCFVSLGDGGIHIVQNKFKKGQVISEATSVKSDLSVAWPSNGVRYSHLQTAVAATQSTFHDRRCLSWLIQQKIIDHTIFAQILNRECKVLDCPVCTVCSHFHTVCKTGLWGIARSLLAQFLDFLRLCT
jgi:hypothetical protein